MQPKKEITHFKRYHGYDYSRGAAMFITFALEPRQMLLGRIEGDRIALSVAGEIV